MTREDAQREFDAANERMYTAAKWVTEKGESVVGTVLTKYIMAHAAYVKAVYELKHAED